MKKILFCLLNLCFLLASCSNTSTCLETPTGPLPDKNGIYFMQFEFADEVKENDKVVAYNFNNVLKCCFLEIECNTYIGLDELTNFDYSSIDYVKPADSKNETFTFTPLCSLKAGWENCPTVEHYFETNKIDTIEINRFFNYYFAFSIII